MNEPDSPRAVRYDSLDIWRGIACLSVVIYHITTDVGPIGIPAPIQFALGKLWLGVQLFFVISGYCIAATTDTSRQKNSTFLTYMRRRIYRIYPPYWVVLGIIAIACLGLKFGHGVNDPYGATTGQIIGNVFLFERWRHLFSDEGQYFLLAPAWTLCYEEQFYLICGLLLLLFRKWFFQAAIAITILSLPLAAINWCGIVNFHGLFFDGYWLQFAAGLLVYYARNYAGRLGRLYGIAGLVLLAVGALTLRLFLPAEVINGYSRAMFFDGTFVAFMYAAFLLAAERFDATIYKAPLLLPIRWCGLMCYSLYLTHQVVISYFTAVSHSYKTTSSVGYIMAIGLFVLTLVIGAAFYHLFEKRFLNS